MHGLIITAVRRFVLTAYGKSVWARLCAEVGVPADRFQSILPYETAILEQLMKGLEAELNVPRSTIMDDIGISIVTDWYAVRRLLRFGGETFMDFLHSLEDLPDRARLAVPELPVPELRLQDAPGGGLDLACEALVNDIGYALGGLLRAMADDYGSLMTIDHKGRWDGFEHLFLQVHDAAFMPGNKFVLSKRQTA